MKQGSDVYLLHIIEAIESIKKQIHGLTEEQFYGSEVIQGFVERKLEIIGEATKRISEEIKNQYPSIPWNEMTAMRNVLIHEYEDVDNVIVWDTVTQYLLPLKKKIKNSLWSLLRISPSVHPSSAPSSDNEVPVLLYTLPETTKTPPLFLSF